MFNFKGRKSGRGKHLQILGVLALCIIAYALQPYSASAQGPQYILNPGDVLDVSVWKEEEMTRQVLVLPDSTISFPLAGHMNVAGMSAQAVQEELVKRIKKYISEPVITVSVNQVTGNKIFVIGQVNNPGEFAVSRSVDVMQALSLAGGLTAFGDEDDIKILRRENGQQIALPFDYSDVKRGNRLDLNVVLKPGDVVVVPD